MKITINGKKVCENYTIWAHYDGDTNVIMGFSPEDVVAFLNGECTSYIWFIITRYTMSTFYKKRAKWILLNYILGYVCSRYE
jgi:hypothetical protein